MDKDNLKKMGRFLLDNPLVAMFDPNLNNHPPIIYKYRSWKNFHKDLLIKNELFMATPSSLNDPFDCRIHENYLKFLNTPEQKQNYINKSLKEDAEYFKKSNTNSKDAELILSKRLEDTLRFQIRSEVISNELADKQIGIACLSEVWNSILMWSHYGDNHKGYCIGYDEKRLRNSQLFGKIGRVNYSQDYPELNPLHKNQQSVELKYFHKSIDWNYEKEIRLMNIFETQKSSRVITLEDRFIKEVILGLKIDPKDKAEILAIAKDKNIPVYQTIKAEFEFRIERYKLT